jgi:8-oxo-dGTP diphosphatase
MQGGLGGHFKIGVFALIRDRHKVLLCHRTDADFWNLPGGALEPAEPPWEGVAREVLEETTLEIKVQQLIGVYSRPEQQEIAFGFLCEVVSGAPQCTDEADALGYYDVMQLPANMNHEQIQAIQMFYENPTTVGLCVQHGPSPLDLFAQEARPYVLRK